MFTFSLPGFIQDFPMDSRNDLALKARWDLYAQSWVQQAMPPTPSFFYDPKTTTIPFGISSERVSWIAFPGRMMQFFSRNPPTSPPNPHNLTLAQVYSLADTGFYTDKDGKKVSFPNIPTTLCPQAEWGGTLQSFGPYGPRGWLDEYCEWSVARDGNGHVTRIDFTCENPEYWYTLWSVDPERVRELYESTLNAGAPVASQISVALEDLQLTDASGKPVIDPSTGRPAYNPLNRWNSGPTSVRSGPASGFTGGAMHLTSTPNTLQTELGLAGASTQQFDCGNSDPQTLICCGDYGQEYRHSDPHIGDVVNRIVGGQGNPPSPPEIVCLANPVGLYIQMPDLGALKFGAKVVVGQTVPAGAKPGDILTIIRGQLAPIDPITGKYFPGDMLLHIAFQIPESWLAMTPTMTLEDLKVNDVPLTWAGQLAAQTHMGLFARPLPAGGTPPQVACAGNPTAGQPLQCMFEALWNGYYPLQEPNPLKQPISLASNTVIVPPALPATGAQQSLVVTCNSPDPANPTVQIMLPDGSGPDPAISSEVISSSQVTYAVPGDSYPGTYTALSVQVSVASGAALGLRDLRIVGGVTPLTLPCAVLVVAS